MVNIIAFLGADGSGKSTLLDNLTISIKLNLIESTIKVIHFRPTIRKKKENVIALPYTKKPHNFFISFAKLFAWYIQYIILLNIYRIKYITQDCYIIFDRHLLDIKFDPLRYRINKIVSKLPFYKFIFPKPEIIFYIEAEASLINGRKNEVTLSETKNQLKNYKNELRKISNVYYINSEQPIETCNQLIIKIIKNKYNLENLTNP